LIRYGRRGRISIAETNEYGTSRSTDVVDEVRRELAHQRGVGVDECPPGSEPVLVRDRLGDETVEQRCDIGLIRLLHLQSGYR